MTELAVGTSPCICRGSRHQPQLVAITGGPGAGKTAVLELARRAFCEHVAILPESAGILFGGGFPRQASVHARRAAQRAIYHVQRELEQFVLEEARVAVALCDRGTVDGLAYWPGTDESYWRECGTSRETELARYAAVVHLEPPAAEQGYDHSNSLRIETAEEARGIDLRIQAAWSGHPRPLIVSRTEDFTQKALRALQLVRQQLPPCCHAHELPGEGAREVDPCTS